MFNRIRQIIEYADRSKVLSEDELYSIILNRVSILLTLGIVISTVFAIIATWSLQAQGLVLDAMAGLLLTSVALDDYLDDLHQDSLAPDAVSVTHSEQTKEDLVRTVDHVVGLLGLVIGFLMQIPAALG